MASDQLVEQATDLANRALELSRDLAALAGEVGQVAVETAASTGGADGASPLVIGLTVFVLAIFVGYHVVWSVTPALHSPLMGVTNAISSVIIVGALIAAGTGEYGFSEIMGFIAVTLASVNIFGGFIVTYRMLSMFKKKPKAAAGGKAQ
ncbi:MAG: NAD(P) transhydrogenase subunit alpha [Kiloniellales bacterium]